MRKFAVLRSALLVCCVGLAITGVANAQTRGGARAIRDALASVNSVSIGQNGGGNAAAVAQDGAGNEAVIRQVGSGNTGSIVQTGDNNSACLLQVGDGLEGSIVQTGDHRRLALLQTAEGERRIPYRRCTGVAPGRQLGAERRRGRAWAAQFNAR